MSTKNERILIIGAGGQIGVELTLALRNIYGKENVIASDLKAENPLLTGTGPFLHVDAMDKNGLQQTVQKEKITQIYLLAAVLSAVGEKNPLMAWGVNMQTILNVLEIAREEQLTKIFWPSSIAIFGATSPKQNCPQQTIVEPTTIYGISKYAGESWCEYYYEKYGVDVRSLRYPGLISYKSAPGGGTTDYAIDIFHQALKTKTYDCFLDEDTYLPMMYMDDGIRATIELMEAPAEKIKNHRSYNLAAMSFSPKEIAAEIQKHIPDFRIHYKPDFRQAIAESWPQSIDDKEARAEWGWKPEFDLAKMTEDMLKNLK
ncbi:MAG TPA: NAD-dependent epimerase/dehydratase family protein [Arachidicoccus soli]|uniref:NAD-dependent epimerase/dehydratase family protein n=1 Tax=Arachidicoccus soli TaxID=2341117 RepID=A0A386HNH5_9BACT|nr:NAD-dependent epimerase/dehydratase family protein [Arachidicoccus soli]AYD47212.1 NAD-dependent epimerase/dehydratase family protein [Arachidicoccus soli]HEU0228879.1 NAD-dependent epimerase/dehydratase family protein [Arachidicoccus soli]